MKRGAWPLAAIAALFVGPLVVAIVLYAGRDSFGGFAELPNPDRELIENPPSLPLVALERPDGSLTDAAWSRSRWSMIYARIGACDEPCADALRRLDAVHLALGADRDRVQTVFLAPEGSAGVPAAAGFLIGRLDVRAAAGLVGVLGPERLEQGRYFVVDPLGNLILSYPADADQSRLLEDLERLLEVSRVG